jgi:hypothetical protein
MDAVKKSTICPVCGYDLGFSPWDGDSPSDEICPSCGMQFGYYDFTTAEELERRIAIYAEWRQRWVNEGMPWNGAGRPPPDWNPAEQLKRLG